MITIQPYSTTLILASLLFSHLSFAQSSVSADEVEIFDFGYQSGVQALDLNGDGVRDIVTVSRLPGISATRSTEFSFVLYKDMSAVSSSPEYSKITIDRRTSNYYTLATSDCVMKMVKLLRIGENRNDWKLLIMERLSQEPGYSESVVEFRILKLQPAINDNFSDLFYRQTGSVITDGSYCNVEDAFEHEWSVIYPALVETLLD